MTLPLRARATPAEPVAPFAPAMPAPAFPATRLRRNRQFPWLRAMVAEHRLSATDLIWPCFVTDGLSAEPITTMPGVSRWPIAQLVEEVRGAAALGIGAVAIFPFIPLAARDANGSAALDPNNLICRAVRAVKAALPQIGVICDVALDPFTSHGHDGVLVDGQIDNDATLAILCQQAALQAEAGCDIIAPSDMMDGRVGAIRAALDTAGHQQVVILSYAAKYASAFYGPFRDALATRGLLVGDKKTYQMDPANSDESLREVALDLAEGADLVMVKPGLPYLDIIRRVKDRFGVPTIAYQVSGEYTMLRLAADAGALDWQKSLTESLLCCKRAGADAILSYGAREVAAWLAAEKPLGSDRANG